MAIEELLTSPSGLVGQHVAAKAQIVQDAAKVQLGPHRKTGRLEASIVKRWTTVPSGIGVLIGSWTCDYALFVHEGTPPHDIPNAFGYGPAFGIGGRFEGKFHPGTEPVRYLTDNLHLAVE